MDIATVVGLILGCALIVTAIILGGTPLIFVNVQSILIVVGGTLAATLIRFPGNEVAKTFQVVKNAFSKTLTSHNELIQQFVELSQISRKEGLLALENLELDDPFMAKGIGYCVDGAEAHAIEGLLLKEVHYSNSRHKVGIKLMKSMGSAAPAFGMIGTLIGLVNMLTSMDDPAGIGPAMAVALLTTLYGAFIANLVCIPVAGKLEFRNDQELALRMMVLEGIVGLRKGENPHMLRETLESFVAPKERQDDQVAA